jgi:hypothetical protein
MVTLVTLICDCNKCGLWCETRVHGGQIVRTKKQWEANPRFFACEHIDGDLHIKETYLRPNQRAMLPGVGYAAEVYAHVSHVAVRMNDGTAPSRPLRVCKRVAVLHDVDVECSDDEERDDDDDDEP